MSNSNDELTDLLAAAESTSSSSTADVLQNVENGTPPRAVWVSLTQRIKSSAYDEFLTWQRDILAANKSQGGFLGATIIEEKSIDNEDETIFITIIKFVSFQTAQLWNLSSERENYMKQLQAITGSKDKMPAQIAIDEIPIFANVFGAGKRDDGRKGGFWFKRRMWLLIWLQVFGMVYLFSWLIPLILKKANLDDNWEKLPGPVKMGIDTMLTTLSIDLLTMRLVVGFCRWIKFI